MEILGTKGPAIEGALTRVLTKDAQALLEALHKKFDGRRKELLAKRTARLKEFDSGKNFEFLPETKNVREDPAWQVASCPADLQKRHVEITGPTERKMLINALNSGADVFMADFEDSLSPTWANIIEGQINLMDAVRRTITLEQGGKSYKLNDKIATLLVRPRGWHLAERHVQVDGQPMSASMFDAALYLFHNAAELKKRGTGPYYYLPKMESHLEARLWNDVFNFIEGHLGIPQGTVRATVLIETLPAAFEIEEILYELREHMSGCNAGRWDYIFSLIKKFRNRKDLILPDRSQITMTVPFMRAYTELLIKTCHKRGAHAMGGMAPFIPSRKNPEINEAALAKVRQDKEREVTDGFDGTWVAHPDLVPTAREVFDRVLGKKPNQKERKREEVNVKAEQLAAADVPGGKITEAGVRNNITVAIQYMKGWLEGNGAVNIYNLMEDAATAEISRGQLWQQLTNGARLDDGKPFTRELYEKFRSEEVAKLPTGGRLDEAVKLLDTLVLGEFVDFLTLPAYQMLD